MKIKKIFFSHLRIIKKNNNKNKKRNNKNEIEK